jgi:hypothetical protein
VNAAEQATNLEFASKIATVVNLFKYEFPDVKSDLKPWHNDLETRELVDQDPITNHRRAIGVEAAGFDHRGEVWRLSTVETWSFIGDSVPLAVVGEKLKQVCRQILEVFNQPSQ